MKTLLAIIVLGFLLNTSLNEGGKPICSTIEQAKKVLKKTKLDYLCVGDTIYE